MHVCTEGMIYHMSQYFRGQSGGGGNFTSYNSSEI